MQSNKVSRRQRRVVPLVECLGRTNWPPRPPVWLSNNTWDRLVALDIMSHFKEDENGIPKMLVVRIEFFSLLFPPKHQDPTS